MTLVIPGRNCAATINPCLTAAVPLKQSGRVVEIVLVDDASTDETRRIATGYDVTVLSGAGIGAAAARNVGWRHAQTPLMWFVDADCVIEAEAFERLVAHLSDDQVGGVGGSYANLRPDSMLACLIHEEIVARHAAMPTEVDFLGGFNVIYRRAALEAVGGFDERYPGATAEDADLSFRVRNAGYRLHFEPGARVGHFHETRLLRYLNTQRRHGFWRVRLHLDHRRQGMGNAYSGVADHIQPPLAMIALASLPLLATQRLWWVPVAALLCLAVLQIPMTVSIVRQARSSRYLMFGALGWIRSFWRGVGLMQGALSGLSTAARSSSHVGPLPRR